MTVTSLYRAFDTADNLLYVGISSQPSERFRQHRADKPWWVRVARIELMHYPNRAAAVEAERHAIQAEAPAYNMSDRTPGPVEVVVVDTPTPGRLVTVEEVSERLSVSRAHVYNLMKVGLPSVKVGRSRRFRMADVEAWIAAQNVEVGA